MKLVKWILTLGLSLAVTGQLAEAAVKKVDEAAPQEPKPEV